MKETKALKDLDETAVMLHTKTLIATAITKGDAGTDRFFSGGLKGVFFSVPSEFAPILPVIALVGMDVRADKVVCTYLLNGNLEYARLELLRAASAFNSINARFSLSGKWSGALAEEYLGSLTITRYLNSYAPLGDMSDNAFVVEFLYENSVFMKE